MNLPIRSLAVLVINLAGLSLLTPSASAEVSAAGQAFAKEAAAGGMFEVKLGEVSEKNAKSAAVKKFGAMMVVQHGKAGDKLAAIAAKENIMLPKQLPKELQTKLEKLSALTGASFDKAYVSEMVMDHEKDLAAFTGAAKDLTDPALKAFAAKTSMMVQMHLDAIRKIQAEMK